MPVVWAMSFYSGAKLYLIYVCTSSGCQSEFHSMSCTSYDCIIAVEILTRTITFICSAAVYDFKQNIQKVKKVKKIWMDNVQSESRAKFGAQQILQIKEQNRS